MISNSPEPRSLFAIQRLPIRYVLVESSKSSGRATIFHLLNEADVALLRCFMTLSLLPADTGDLVPEQPPFGAAFKRVRGLPSFRKAQAGIRPPTAMWEDLIKAPL